MVRWMALLMFIRTYVVGSIHSADAGMQRCGDAGMRGCDHGCGDAITNRTHKLGLIVVIFLIFKIDARAIADVYGYAWP